VWAADKLLLAGQPTPPQAAAPAAPPALSRTFSAAARAAHSLENDSPDAATLSEPRQARHR